MIIAQIRRYLADAAATVALSNKLADALQRIITATLGEETLAPWLIFLKGELGCGKSYWVRGLLHGLGWPAEVPSPSFSLREDYALANGYQVAHLDLYRLQDPAELESLDLQELLRPARVPRVICIEWPQIAASWLPPPDLELQFNLADMVGEAVGEMAGEQAVELDQLGRWVTLSAHQPRGALLVQQIQQNDHQV